MIDESPEAPPVPAPDPAHRAFMTSAAHTFLGQPLQPFSVGRQIAAQALGHRLLCARARLDEGGIYDGMFADVIWMLYLCTRDKAASVLAVSQPEKVRAAAIEWAEATQIFLGSSAYHEAARIHWEILAELQAAQFDPGAKAGGDSPNV
jgi:hypothetical protein